MASDKPRRASFPSSGRGASRPTWIASGRGSTTRTSRSRSPISTRASPSPRPRSTAACRAATRRRPISSTSARTGSWPPATPTPRSPGGPRSSPRTPPTSPRSPCAPTSSASGGPRRGHRRAGSLMRGEGPDRRPGLPLPRQDLPGPGRRGARPRRSTAAPSSSTRPSTEAKLSVATALAAKGDKEGAARAFAKAAGEVLPDAESYDMRGLMHFVSGQEELALADYEASLALDPTQPDTVARRGLLRSRLGRREEALTDFTRLIAMTPTEARGYWRRGEVPSCTWASPLPGRSPRSRSRRGPRRRRARRHLLRPRDGVQETLGDAGRRRSPPTTRPSPATPRTSPSAPAASRSSTPGRTGNAAASRSRRSSPRRRRTPRSSSASPASSSGPIGATRRSPPSTACSPSIPENAEVFSEPLRRCTSAWATPWPPAPTSPGAYELAPDDRDIRSAHGRYVGPGAAKTPEERDAAYDLEFASAAELRPENAWRPGRAPPTISAAPAPPSAPSPVMASAPSSWSPTTPTTSTTGPPCIERHRARRGHQGRSGRPPRRRRRSALADIEAAYSSSAGRRGDLEWELRRTCAVYQRGLRRSRPGLSPTRRTSSRPRPTTRSPPSPSGPGCGSGRGTWKARARTPRA